MTTFLMAQWQPTSHAFPEKQLMATFLMASAASPLPSYRNSQWRRFSWLNGSQPLMGFLRDSQWRHFSWLQQPTLSQAPGTANGDVSHGSTAANLHGFQRIAMATFLMVQKAANF